MSYQANVFHSFAFIILYIVAEDFESLIKMNNNIK